MDNKILTLREIETRRRELKKEMEHLDKIEQDNFLLSKRPSGAISIRLKQLRQERGMKQYEFAEFGIEDKHVSELECGNYNPFKRLDKMLKGLKVSRREFFNHPLFD